MKKIYIHDLSDVRTKNIGEGTCVWQYCVILENANIGSNCNICSHVFIENHVLVGNDVTIKNGVQLWDGVEIGDNVFIGPNVSFCNDNFPRSKKHPAEYLKTIVRSGASIGANATILPGIEVGKNAMVGAGAVVTRDVPANAIVVGNPAQIHGYANRRLAEKETVEINTEVSSAILGNVRFHKLPIIRDLRGVLSFGEYSNHLPFLPKRYFLIYDVPSKEVRGEHAHKRLDQFLICVKGACSVVLDDGIDSVEVRLDSPEYGLHIPPMVWAVQYKYTKDAVLLVLASDVYDESDYIRKYDEFIRAVNL